MLVGVKLPSVSFGLKKQQHTHTQRKNNNWVSMFKVLNQPLMWWLGVLIGHSPTMHWTARLCVLIGHAGKQWCQDVVHCTHPSHQLTSCQFMSYSHQAWCYLSNWSVQWGSVGPVPFSLGALLPCDLVHALDIIINDMKVWVVYMYSLTGHSIQKQWPKCKLSYY